MFFCHRTATFASAALFAAGVLLPLSGDAQATEEFHDSWYLKCRDNGYCVAEAKGVSDANEEMVFKLERAAEPNSVVFVTSAPEYTLELGMRVDIDVKGLENSFGVFGEVKRVYQGNEMTFSGPARRELVENLRAGDTAVITIAFGGPVGTKSYSVPLNGLTGALLGMDQAQDRFGREDAIVAWGGRDVGSLKNNESPTQTTAPTSSQTQVASVPSGGGNRWADIVYEQGGIPEPVLQYGRGNMGCDLAYTLDAYGASVHGEGAFVLHLIPCEPADANVSYYVAASYPNDPGRGHLFSFQRPLEDNAPDTSKVFNPQWDSDRQTMTTQQYYGPNSDCGIFMVHEYVRDEGRFDLIEVREKANCNGVFETGEQYPLKWSIDEMGQ